MSNQNMNRGTQELDVPHDVDRIDMIEDHCYILDEEDAELVFGSG